MTNLYPVIMCGGSGTRLWPLSKRQKPKQYHALATEHSLLQDTMARLKFPKSLDSSIKIMPPSFVCALGHEDIILAQAQDIGFDPLHIILEPVARNTAAVGAVISEVISATDPDGVVLLLPADHFIGNVEEFWIRLLDAVAPVQSGEIVTLGIHPTRAETGYGYILAGAEMSDHVVKVDSFVEKPDAHTAQTYLDQGNYFWNAGIFVFTAKSMTQAFEKYAPDILAQSRDAVRLAKVEGPIHYLEAQAFSKCRSESIDYAIMQEIENMTMVAPVDIGWNDIGSWQALHELLQTGTSESVISGDVIDVESQNSFIRSDGPLVATIGLVDMMVIASEDAVLIAPLARSQDVKKIVETLKRDKRISDL